MSDNYLIVH